MISSSGYPCVIQEFDSLLPLDPSRPFTAKECALTNLNTFRLQVGPLTHYVGGFVLPSPQGAQGPLPLTGAAMGAWALPADRPWHVDTNCNEPEDLCQSCPLSPSGAAAPPDSGSLSPASTPSLSSLTSSTTSSSSSPSPLSSSPESDASPDPPSSGRAGKHQGPVADHTPEPELGAELPPQRPLAPRPDLNQNLGGGHHQALPLPPPGRLGVTPGKAAPLRSPLPVRPSNREFRDTVPSGPRLAYVTLSPFEGCPRPFPIPLAHGQHLITFEDSPTGTEPCPEELRRETTPCPEELRRETTPCPEELRRETTPCPEELRRETTPCPEELRRETTPCPEELRRETTPCPEELRRETTPCPEELRRETKPCPEELRRETTPCPKELRRETKPCPEEVCWETTPFPEELRQQTKPRPEELHQEDKAHTKELRQETKPSPEELHQEDKAHTKELRQVDKAHAEELSQEVKTPPKELLLEIQGHPAELHLEAKRHPAVLQSGARAQLHPGTKAQAAELRPETKSQSAELRPGTKAQAAELRSGTKAQAADLHPGTKTQYAELRPGTKAQPDTRTPRNITSFHELAQKRRQSTAGHSAVKVKEDRSDWLMAFSPDGEMPPAPAYLVQDHPGTVVPYQSPSSQHKEVTTFRELRYRNHLGRWKLAPSEARPDSSRPQATRGSTEQGPGPTQTALRPGLWRRSGGRALHTGPSPESEGWLERAMGLSDTQHHRGHDPMMTQREGDPDSDSCQCLRQHRLEEAAFGAGGGTEPAVMGEGCDRWRGKADGQDKTRKEAVWTWLGLGLSRTGWCRMATVSPSVHIPDGDPSPDWAQHKRGLLWDISLAVDKIIGHFSAARNIVQKAQLGDSRVNPTVGQLVLEDLCPALHAVLSDGLNPYQQDIIVGRRPQTPWSLVEASVKTGPAMQTLYPAYCQLRHLWQLRTSLDKFNAFIFVLLNLKLLEFWISSLLNSRAMLRTRFSPTALLSVSTSCWPTLSEELLLLFQPLSAFTFQLDPLFAYHHPLPQREGLPTEPNLTPLATNSWGATRDALLRGAAQGAVLRGMVRVPGDREGSLPTLRGGAGTGFTFQQTLGQLRHWGDRVAQALINTPPFPAQTPRENCKTTPSVPGAKPDWWDHLRQGSQIYLVPSRLSSVSPRELPPKAMGTECTSALGTGTSELGPETFTLQQGTSTLEPGSSVLDQGTSALGPGTSALGTGTSALEPEASTLDQACSALRPGTSALEPGTSPKTQGPSPQFQGYKRQISNCGGKLSELQGTGHRGVSANCTDATGPVPPKDSMADGHRSREEQHDPMLGSTAQSDRLEAGSVPGPHVDGQSPDRAQRPVWLGRLFGARVPSTYSPTEQEVRTHRGRLPSAWFQVDLFRVGELLKERNSSVRPTTVMPPAPPAKPAQDVTHCV